MAATVGAAPNTGSQAWVVPLQVPAGMYHFAIRPLTGQRRFEVRAVGSVWTGPGPKAVGDDG